MRWLFTIPFVLLAFSARAEPKPYAIDGDTLALGSERIRILGLDTPETYSPQCQEESRLGYQAQGRLQHLLHTRTVRIERSITERDKYRRTLAVVYVGKDRVDELLVREGLARPYTGKTRREPWCPAPAGKAREAAY